MPLPRGNPRRVFINCPFDKNYKPLFDAIVFAVHDLGFQAWHAMIDQAQEPVRLHRIASELASCRYSIHDLSRVETSGQKRVPRFNMPFEAGIAYALQRFGNGPNGHCIVLLDSEQYRYQQALSDAAGLDPLVHGNAPERVIERVRDFLRRASGEARLPGAAHVIRRYNAFRGALPSTARALNFKMAELRSWPYVNDLQHLIQSYIAANPA